VPKLARKEKPKKFGNYQSFKPFLRRDFSFRCAYCEISEAEYGSFRNFAVEHFKPKKKFPALVCHYPNLFYACSLCNSFKGETWPSPKLIKQGLYFLNPCDHEFAEHLYEKFDGALQIKSNAGDYTVQYLHLNSEQRKKTRTDRRSILNLIRKLKTDKKEMKSFLPRATNADRIFLKRKIQQVDRHIHALDRRFGRMD